MFSEELDPVVVYDFITFIKEYLTCNFIVDSVLPW
jgi:hypothetical protein